MLCTSPHFIVSGVCIKKGCSSSVTRSDWTIGCDFGQRRERGGAESRCIIQRGDGRLCTICVHIPVALSELIRNPWPFQSAFHQFCHVCRRVCVCWHVDVCVLLCFQHESARCLITFPLDYKVQVRHTWRVFLSLFCCRSNQRSRFFFFW